ncbi:hypothetical protein FRC12_010832 [Ceratobasidium sp. 428]|nr:hypothetical protein FRC12_010832 [Ceratobasidium sp. 428]
MFGGIEQLLTKAKRAAAEGPSSLVKPMRHSKHKGCDRLTGFPIPRGGKENTEYRESHDVSDSYGRVDKWVATFLAQDVIFYKTVCVVGYCTISVPTSFLNLIQLDTILPDRGNIALLSITARDNTTESKPRS